MKPTTLTELYITGKISPRLYNSLRVNFVTDKDETGGEFTLYELWTLLEEKGIGKVFRTRYTGKKTLNEFNDFMKSFTGKDYIGYERGEALKNTNVIESMRNETLKLTRLLMGEDVDVDSVKRKLALIVNISKKI